MGARIMGIDPAEYGKDDTVFIVRQGRVVLDYQRHHGKGTMEVVGLAARFAEQWKPDVINGDAGGLGSGIMDRLIELGYPVNRILFGERAVKDDLYGIRRDEMWGEMKAWFEDKPNQIPDDRALQAEITSPGFTHDSSRRLKVESKESMQKRGIKSPDGGDALALTFAMPARPKKRTFVQQHQVLDSEVGF
jgi:hypothetical protein